MSRYYEQEKELKLEDGTIIRSAREILVHTCEAHVLGKRLGRNIEHDSRSKDFSVFVSDEEKEFNSVEWEMPFDALNQGNVGSCCGNAMAGWIMSSPALKEKNYKLTQNDAVELYSLATALDHFPMTYPDYDTGTTGLAVAKAARKLGFIDGYHHAFTLRAALKALQNGPLITGFGWYDSFDDPDLDGYVKIKNGSVVRGGHEVLVYGLNIFYDDKNEIDENGSYVKMRNSWGKEFGVNGNFYMTLKTWMFLMKEYGDITVPIYHG